MSVRLALISSLAVAGAGLVGGCSADPNAPLIPLPQRQATILPSEAPERAPDGFANILADPATVAGLPRDPREIAAEEAYLAAEGRQAEAETASIHTTSSVAALRARGRNHVAETRAAIEASARPQTGAPTTLTTLPQSNDNSEAGAQGAPVVDPGQPVDPNAPVPRSVGGPPFLGKPVAPDG